MMTSTYQYSIIKLTHSLISNIFIEFSHCYPYSILFLRAENANQCRRTNHAPLKSVISSFSYHDTLSKVVGNFDKALLDVRTGGHRVRAPTFCMFVCKLHLFTLHRCTCLLASPWPSNLTPPLNSKRMLQKVLGKTATADDKSDQLVFNIGVW